MMTPTPSGHGIIWPGASRAAGGGRAPARTDPVALAQVGWPMRRPNTPRRRLFECRADASKRSRNIRRSWPGQGRAGGRHRAGQARAGRAAARAERDMDPHAISPIPTRG